jgi:ATP-dependent protease ClpP protease subunit
MTIHPVRINGVVVGAPQTYRYFEDMQKRIIKFICDHSSANEAEINELMMRPDELATDVGSIIDGDQAVKCGIISAVGGLSDALGALREMITENRK